VGLTSSAGRHARSVVIVALMIALGPSRHLDAQRPPAAEAAEAAEPYVIGPEDVIEIAVWSNTDLSRTVPVRPDGKISLPLLHDVQAGGLTPMQLRAALTASLEKFVARPVVSVIVREVHSFKVTVIGEVKTPGRFEVRSRTTVLDVLAVAGGLSQYAARGRITILRREGDTVQQLPFDFEKVTGKTGPNGAGQQNFCVRPGDIVVVP
jgi:polysaccharide export outer membrane protein